MGTRSIFKGSLNFALLSIGIRAYKATGKSNISFRMLHKDCGTPMKMKRKCEKCNREIEWDDLVKGYEIDESHFVIFTDEEIASLSDEGNKAIKISECIPRNIIDSLALSDFYYIIPEKGFSRAYLLLREAMRSINCALVGKWIYHGKENIIAVMPHENIMTMTILRYAEEITGLNDIPATIDMKEMPSGEEIKLGIELLKKFTNKNWKLPDSSEYVKKFEALMNAKSTGAIGQSIREVKVETVYPKNLMDELRGSLMVMTSATASASVSASVSASEMNVGAEVQEIDGKKEEKTEKAKEKAKRSKKKKE